MEGGDGVVIRTFRYRLYPSKDQILFLDNQLGEACALYNAALEERGAAWKLAHSINYFDQANQLREIRAAGNLALANYCCCQDVLRRVDKAFQGFFGRVKRGDKPGYPRFRSRSRYDSITFPAYGDGCRLLDSGRLRIQGAGEIKVKLHRLVEGRIKTVTVKRSAGKWFVCFVVECPDQPLSESSEAIGIDVGLTSFAVLSDGSVIENPRYYRKAQARIRVAQRKVARRKKRGKNSRKAICILQRAHARIKNQRADFQHQEARKLVNRYGLIAVENLNLKGLAGSMLAKSVHDAGWGMFLQRIEDKAECAGRTFVRVNPNGTTQNCSACGTRVPKDLSQRWHLCPECGLSLSRDENAARNILLDAIGPGLGLWALTWDTGPCVAQEAAQL